MLLDWLWHRLKNVSFKHGCISGQAQRFGVREADKILTINGKAPRNVDDAVGVIKQVHIY